jgi:hypothetical protein
MNRIIYFLLAILQVSCKSKVDSYIAWYNDFKPYSIAVAGGDVLLKEVPEDMLYIQTHKGSLQADELNIFREKLNIRQLSFEFKKAQQTPGNLPRYGKELECAIDGIPPIDVLQEMTDNGAPTKVTFVFDKIVFDSGSQIQIAHPEIKEIITADMHQLRITDKRRLKL